MFRSARKAPKTHPSTVIHELGVKLVRRVTFTNSQLLLLHFRGHLLYLSLFSVKHILFQSWMSGRDVDPPTCWSGLLFVRGSQSLRQVGVKREELQQLMSNGG